MKVCGKKDIHVPGCDDCQELEERVEAVEECCEDAQVKIEDKADTTYVDENVSTIEGQITEISDALNERIDNIITSSEPSITTLWEGDLALKGHSVQLSDNVNNYDFLDVYYKTSTASDSGYYGYIRVPSDEYENYTTTIGGINRRATGAGIRQYLTMLSFVDDTATIQDIRRWYWDGSAASDAEDSSYQTGIGIYRIDGVKISGVDAEIADARVGVDGTIYPSLGDAIRGQIQDTRDMIPQLVKTVQGNPIVIDDAFGEVKNLDVELLPIQDLHGYSKPWAAGAGANILDLEAYIKSRTQDYSVDSNGWITINNLGNAGLYANHWFVGALASRSIIVLIDSTRTTATNVRVRIFNDTTAITETTAKLENYQFDNIGFNWANNGSATVKIAIVNATTISEWTPYSNICPITGHGSVTVGVTGKNLFDESTATIYHRYFQDLGGTHVWAADGSSSTYAFTCKPNTTYTVSCNNPSITIFRTGTIHVNPSDVGSSDTPTIYNVVKKTAKGATTITTDSDDKAIIFQMNNAIITNRATESQIEYDNTATDFVPYHGQSKTVTLPHTVYGAGVGVTSGSGTEKYGIVDLGTLNWGYNSNYGVFYSAGIDTLVKSAGKCICDSYASVTSGDITTDGGIQIGRVGWFNQDVIVKDTRYSDASAFKQAVSGVMFCYELATPTDLSTTPTSLTLYNGDNVISSDGDMDLTYVQDMAIVIRKIEAQI